MEKRDWAEKDLREHLIEARKGLWTEEQIARISKWANIGNTSAVLDIGCGLGYLGKIFLEYIPQGAYTGIDISEKLITEVSETFTKIDFPILFEFKTMNSEALEYPDNSFDLVMCQTVLMHLEEPEKSLNEMYRVLKPGGTLLCIEPDHSSARMRDIYNSNFDMNFEDSLLWKTVQLYCIEGEKRLKNVDWGIGLKLPALFHKLGLADIDMLQNEKVALIIPPYTSPNAQKLVERFKNLKEKKYKRMPINQWHKKTFLAGGGSEYMYRKYRKLCYKYNLQSYNRMKEGLAKHEFLTCSGSVPLYVCRGIKDKEC